MVSGLTFVASQTLYECIEEYSKGEVLGKDDMWFCSSCKDSRQVCGLRASAALVG